MTLRPSATTKIFSGICGEPPTAILAAAAEAGNQGVLDAPGSPPLTITIATVLATTTTPTLADMVEAEATTTTAIEAVVVMVVEATTTIFLPAADPREAVADVFKSFTRSGPDSDFLVRHGIA
jgi:hypothetical protein